MAEAKRKPWMVCQGNYGVVVRRIGPGQTYPGGKHWYFDTEREARQATDLIAHGRYDRPPDEQRMEFGRKTKRKPHPKIIPLPLPPTASSRPEATGQAPDRAAENAREQSGPDGRESKAIAAQEAKEAAAQGASPAQANEPVPAPTEAPDLKAADTPNAKLTSFSPRTKKAKKVPGFSLAKLESQFERVQAGWATMDRKRLRVAMKGGAILKEIKKTVKREGKSFAAWHGDQEAAGKIGLTLRTLQKWMRVAAKWPVIEGKATGMGLDPNDLGLDEALALAVKPRPKQSPKPSTDGRAGREERRKKTGLEAKYKLKITCEVSGVVMTDLTSDEIQTLFNSGEAVLKADIVITDSAGRQLSKVLDAEAAPEVVVEEWQE